GGGLQCFYCAFAQVAVQCWLNIQNQVSTQGLSQHLLGSQTALARYGVSQVATHGVTTGSQKAQLGTASLCNRIGVGSNYASLIRVDSHIAQQDSHAFAGNQAV